LRNKIEGVNRARGEALETVHHLFVAKRKGYITEHEYLALRGRYEECVCMLNGLERKLDLQLDVPSQRWRHEPTQPGEQSRDREILNPEP
jgi:hypothetical protein